jgi:hypothetical protein
MDQLWIASAYYYLISDQTASLAAFSVVHSAVVVSAAPTVSPGATVLTTTETAIRESKSITSQRLAT